MMEMGDVYPNMDDDSIQETQEILSFIARGGRK